MPSHHVVPCHAPYIYIPAVSRPVLLCHVNSANGMLTMLNVIYNLCLFFVVPLNMNWNGNTRHRTTSAYSKVVAIAKAAGVADARWVQAMKNILWGMPNANYNCLRRVLA